jgi:hypothetical protein
MAMQRETGGRVAVVSYAGVSQAILAVVWLTVDTDESGSTMCDDEGDTNCVGRIRHGGHSWIWYLVTREYA